MMYFDVVYVCYLRLYFKELYLCEYGGWVEGMKYDTVIEEAIVGSPGVGFAVLYDSVVGVGMVMKGGNILNFT